MRRSFHDPRNFRRYDSCMPRYAPYENASCSSYQNPHNVSVPMDRRRENYEYNARHYSTIVRGRYNRGNYQASSELYRDDRCQSHKPRGRSYRHRKGPSTMHRQVSISEYIDMESIFEDPWADLVQKLNEERKQNGEPPLDLDGSSSMTTIDCEITKTSEKKENVDSDHS